MHASKPHLRPELVLPLLPDADRFDDPFVQAVFDAEPTAESERHRHYGADVREEMAARVRLGRPLEPRKSYIGVWFGRMSLS